MIIITQSVFSKNWFEVLYKKGIFLGYGFYNFMYISNRQLTVVESWQLPVIFILKRRSAGCNHVWRWNYLLAIQVYA